MSMDASPNDNLVAPDDACPRCGERDADRLVWLYGHLEGYVRCVVCGEVYEPGGPRDDR